MSVRARADIVVHRSPEDVFDVVTAPDAVGKTFVGHGPVPAAQRSEVLGDGVMRVGATRRVHNADGSVVDEEIVELERPHTQAYRLVSGLRPPFTWLVSEAGGRWRIEPAGEGTRVRWVFSFQPRSWLTKPLVQLLIQPAFRRAMEKCLANTKRLLES